jgi:mannopine transport system substrate-binding protein
MASSRREFLNRSASILAAGVPFSAFGACGVHAQASTDSLAERAIKANQKEVVIAGAPGAFGETVKKTFYDPFTAATGIKVVPVAVGQRERLAKLQAQYASGNKEWDIIVLPSDQMPGARPFLRDLGDCSELPNVVNGAVVGTCIKYGVNVNVGAGVLAYNTEIFPNGGPQPKGWADFWDVKTFPGQRSLPNIGSPWWPLAAALIADGADPKKLFPLDIERAFKKLDQLKPYFVWWASGDQSMQVMRSREVVMGMMFIGRAINLRAQGVRINVVWNGAPIDANFWAATKDAPHPLSALALINFVFTRPEAHVQFMKATGESTLLNAVLPLLDDDTRRSAAVEPSNWASLIHPDEDWLAGVRDRLLTRWNTWIAS